MTVEETIARADALLEEVFAVRIDQSEELLMVRGATREEAEAAIHGLIADFVTWKRKTLADIAERLRFGGQLLQ